jgi:alpha-acetolactate decarboxylase
MRGIYRVDYYDSRLPIIDTFEYQLKDDKIEITKVQPAKTVNGISVTNFALLRRRFLLSGSATDKITLTRLDTTGFYIRAIKQ